MTGDRHGQRPADPGDYCTCGRPATIIFTGGRFGDTGYCGREAPPGWGCAWCDEGRHVTRCPSYRVRPDVPAWSTLTEQVWEWLT